MPAPDTKNTEPPAGYDTQTATIIHEWPEVRGLRPLLCSSEIAPGTLLLCIEDCGAGERREILRVFARSIDDTAAAHSVGTVMFNSLQAAADAWMGAGTTWQ